MKLSKLMIAATVAAAGLASVATSVQAQEQYLPVLSYRTGASRPTAHPRPMASWTTTSWSTRAAASTA